jgi:tetratricopeptide (TPR) repeat protein
MNLDDIDQSKPGDLPDLLAAFDEALKAGDANNTPPDALSSDDRAELERAQACLRLLEDVFPRSSVTLRNGKDVATTVSAIPDFLGRFEICRELGRGGFGIVYLAYDPQLNREVALKVPHAHALADPEMRARFQREAQAAAGLDHANLVSVFETGEANQVTYIALAYCPGVSLADWLRQRAEAVPQRDAAALIATLAAAVHYAHERGIVHRDLKPANVLLQNAGEQAGRMPLSSFVPKVADFGLAKDLDDQAAQTHTGTIAGTPCYMAPEQAGARGLAIGPATDVYALGAILYELLTGRAPFQGESILDTLHQVRFVEPIPPGRLRSGLSRDLETICLKCIEKEPAKRYASAAALADDLQRFLANKPIVARPVGPAGRLARWCRRNPAVAGLAAALLIAFVGGFAGIAWEWQRAEDNAVRATNTAEDLKIEHKKVVEQWERAEQHLGKARDLVDRLTALAYDISDHPGLDQTGRKILLEAMAFHEEFLKEKGTDPTVRLGTARSFGRVGDIYHTLQQWEQAEKAVNTKIKMVDALNDEIPGKVTYRFELAHALRSLGHILRDQGKNQDARKAYDRAIAIEKKLHEEDLSIAGRRIALASSLLNSVNVLPASESEEIERRRTWAVRLQEEAVDISPTRGYRQELALGLTGMASLHLEHGEKNRAEKVARQALDLHKELHQEDPKERWFDRYVALSHRQVAGIVTTHDPTEAKAHYRDALRLLGKLVEDFGTRPIYRIELADTQVDLCRLLNKSDELAEFEALLGQALVHYDKLAKDNPTEPRHLRKQPPAALLLGQRLRDNKKYTEAQQAFQRMLAANDRLIRQFKGKPGDRYNRAWDLGLLSETYELGGKLADAEQYLRQSIGEFRQLAHEHPTNASYGTALATRADELTRLLLREKKLQEALAASGAAVVDWHQLTDAFKGDASHRAGLAESFVQRGELLRADRQYVAAGNAYRAAVLATPNDARRLNVLASFLLNCPDTKLQSPAEARDLAERATKVAPRDAAGWNHLGAACYRLKDYRSTVKALEESARLAPAGVDWLSLSMAYLQLGDLEGATRSAKGQKSPPKK